MSTHVLLKRSLALVGSLVLPAGIARAGNDGPSPCKDLPSYTALRAALEAARAQANGGFNLEMWATVVNRDGIVCAVAFTGNSRGDQWPGSRVISAQKANTANAFSSAEAGAVDREPVTPPCSRAAGSSAFRRVTPWTPTWRTEGDPADYGQWNDPMVGGRIGGVNVFGGGLALYAYGKRLIGAVGVSGDSSCADHNIAWRTRNNLKLDYLPGGVSGDPLRPDNIVYDIAPQPGQMPGVSASGWGHPECSIDATNIAGNLPVKR